MSAQSIIVDETHSGFRIDSFLSESFKDLSRTYIQKLIKDGHVSVNGILVRPNYRICMKELISVNFPEPEILDVLPENIPIDIIYEDSDIIIVNKGKGMVVHPAAGHYSGTLVNALLYHCRNDQLSGINGVLRPGIVHRIDKDTTGVLVVCKNDRAHQALSEQLAVHSITRTYEAIARGRFTERIGTISAPIGRHPVDRKKMAINYQHGKEAITHYSVLNDLNGKYSHISCQLETGRTHQIRVHMASINHPLLGDTVYGSTKQPMQVEGQVLHAKVLGFVHPSTGKYVEFSSPLPEYFTELLGKLSRG